MRETMPLEKWEGLRILEGKAFLEEGRKAVYDFPHTMDMRKYDELAFFIEAVQEDFWLETVLYPLSSGRPEFIESTRACVWIAPGTERVAVPMELFDHSELVSAHMRYIDRIELAAGRGRRPEERREGSEAWEGLPEIKEIRLCTRGDFRVSVEETRSGTGEAGEMLSYGVILENEADFRRYVTVGRHRLGRESMVFAFPDRVLLEPGETKRIEVTATVPETMPRGGWEKAVLEWMADGRGDTLHRTVLYGARGRQHPYLLHTKKGWRDLKDALSKDGELGRAFEREYAEAAEAWQPPKPHGGGYVYESSSQDGFLKTGIAWKLTGKGRYLAKVLKYVRGLLDQEKGYFATGRTYFQFAESKKEYEKGDFPEHHACSAGWVQEAEFMIKLAFVYDLIWDCGEVDRGMRAGLERLMRSYMAFESWRLTDGDGNNFQLAEATAGLFFACLLQDQPLTERFLRGTNGLYELMGAVFSDDGSYFEGAAGYMRLAAEILLQAAVALENLEMNFKDVYVPASFDKNVIHAPWALREGTGRDGRPFLGMSFARDEAVERPARRLRDYMDMLRRMLNPWGILFSSNDSNEQDFSVIMETAAYVYRDPRYLVGKGGSLLYGPHMLGERGGILRGSRISKEQKDNICGSQMFGEQGRALGFPALEEPEELAQGEERSGILQDLDIGAKTAAWEGESLLNHGNGFAILRGEGTAQAVLKFGQHGGYHGHFDRLSLLSFMKGNRTFHNNEYAWYGYDSFLFKMWVQTSMAHNMTVVDGRMQKPSPCQCVYYADHERVRAKKGFKGGALAGSVVGADGREGHGTKEGTAEGGGPKETFSAVCAQTVTEWMDPPYGGQTPYLQSFPEEKCAGEGRSVLSPEHKRRQGEIGEYSEPVFQRRLLILFHGYCIVWDYLEGQRRHRYDCLYHPMGSFENEEGIEFHEAGRFSADPFGAGQFVMNCHSGEAQGTLCLRFHRAQARVNGNDIIDYLPETAVWRVWPRTGDVTVGRYPQRGDTFTEENQKATEGYLAEPLKKVVSFSAQGERAGFITLLESGDDRIGRIKSVECRRFDCILITEESGESFRISARGMEDREGRISVEISVA